MAALESVNHNFPHLAKQSGFYFQLHKGKVNWSDIENLDINEIIERRNFELLEDNLVNVLNFNLEKEYSFKHLDQNFLKMFKLAQLGVDYLSYCEMYLDKCVVLLQEQLIAYQDECELLRKEIQKKKEGNKSKSRNKAINYQCEKCAKVFISDVYLKFHEKRRHSSPEKPENLGRSPQKCSCNCQQNENNSKLSTSTQTVFLDEFTKISSENEDANNLKTEHVLKVEKLEYELQELKERLKKAESTLLEKTEAPKPNVFHSVNIPNSVHYNPMLMLLPSCLTHPGNTNCNTNSNCQISVPDVCKPNYTVPPDVSSEPVNSKPITETVPDSKKEPEIECKVTVEQNTNPDFPGIIENFNQSEEKEEPKCEKENLESEIKASLVANIKKPLPPPRKLKKGTKEPPGSEIAAVVKTDGFVQEKKPESFSTHLIVRSTPVKEKAEEKKPESFSTHLIVRSTPIKEKEEEETDIFECSIGNISEINKPKANSIENLQSKKSVTSESKSFIKKIVTRDTPTIQRLGQNFKKSLNNLYDSVSLPEKEVKKKETNFQSMRTAVVESLNNHLQQLGVSSEWSGIPRKTMKQKLRAWKHQNRLLTKQNPLYPVIRQNIEEKILQKLKKNFSRKKTNKSSKPESVNITSAEIQNILFEDKSEFLKSRNCLPYDTDSDSESKASDSVKNFQITGQNNQQKTVVLEEITSSEEEEKEDVKNTKDISAPQAGGSGLKNIIEDNKKFLAVNRRDKLFINSDTESSFLENFDGNYEKEKLQFRESFKEKAKESQSILKEGREFYTKPVTNTQKKVLFASYPKGTDDELSDNPTDDDLWSLKSYSERNLG